MAAAGWNPAEFQQALDELKSVTAEEDSNLPDMKDVITEALDSLFGDYINLKQLPRGDLDWVGTHLWKDVVNLQGPEVESPPLAQAPVTQAGTATANAEDCNLVDLARIIQNRAKPTATSNGSLTSPTTTGPSPVVELPHRSFQMREKWNRLEMENDFIEERVSWPLFAEHIMDGSWYHHDNPNSKFQQVFNATAPPGYERALETETSFAEVMRRKRPRGESWTEFDARQPAVPANIPPLHGNQQVQAVPSVETISLNHTGRVNTPSSETESSQIRAPTSFSSAGDSDNESLKRRRIRTAEICADPKLMSRAAERRSREKLKNSMQELILAVPGLAESNPKKATVISKAVGYLSELKRKNTELQAVVKALEESRLQEVPHEKKGALDGLVTVEIVSSGFKFLFVDSTWEQVMGYPAHDVMGKATHDFFSCTSCALIEAVSLNIKERLEAGLEWKGVMLCRRANGEFLGCWGHMYGCKDENGNFSHYICTRKNFVVLDVSKKSTVCAMQSAMDAQRVLNVELPEEEKN